MTTASIPHARITPAEPPYTESIATALDRIMPPGRPPLLLFRVLARDERLFQRLFAGGLLDRGNLTLRMRELAILRTTANCKSEYEWGVHVAGFAERAGFTEVEVDDTLNASPSATSWSDAERILLRLMDELHDRANISDALWADAIQHFTEPQLLELIMLAGYYHLIAFLTNGLRLPLEPWASRF